MSGSTRWLTLLPLAVLVLALAYGVAATDGRATTTAERVPELPRILSARVVLGTRYGTAVRVSYCFSSIPSDPYRAPWRLRLTVDNLKDGLPPLSVPWEVPTRCGTITHPVGGLQQPYVLRYSVESRRGTQSRQGLIRLALHPALARRPDAPRKFVARVVAGPDGKSIRVSYCFRSLPTDRSKRPATLWVTIFARPIDPRDEATLGSSTGGPIGVEARCGSASFGVKGYAPPYRITYHVVSKNGTRSKRLEITVR